MADREIVTEHIYPPIPRRDFDWVAYFDGDEEDGPRGWATTEQGAIADLRENTGELCRCGKENPISCDKAGCPVGADI